MKKLMKTFKRVFKKKEENRKEEGQNNKLDYKLFVQ